MGRFVMRLVETGEIPPGGGKALQEGPRRPVFSGHGPHHFSCAQCANPCP